MYDYTNKRGNIDQLNKYMLSRTLSMFTYEGLPETLPNVEIEKQLQVNGFTFVTEVNGSLYAFYGGLGGEPNAYNEPTKITINNPALNFYDTLDIEKDGVLIKNDDMMLGLMPLYEKYNTLLIENEITMFLNSYNTRIQQLISAGDDATKESAELYIKKVIDGELGIIGENRLFEGIKVQNTQTNNSAITTQLIEFNQYIKASLYNEVGLNANYNMKRERLNTSEVSMNRDNLHPLIDNMLLNREQGIEKLNEMFGLDSHVEFGSIWRVRNAEKEMVIEDTEQEEQEQQEEQVIGEEEQQEEQEEQAEEQAEEQEEEQAEEQEEEQAEQTNEDNEDDEGVS